MQWLLLLITVFFAAASTAQVNRNDVIIDEIMADPTPTKGLPDAEFLELKNTSARPVNLKGWKISDAAGSTVITTAYVLQPDSFVVICSSGSKAILSNYGAALAVNNFPSLDNTGELLALRSGDGKLVHAVEYNRSWYRNDFKSDGGWTLEMIDTRNACSGAANWKASIGIQGGTPGRKNSVDAVNADLLSPTLVRSFAADSFSVHLVFDEPVDSAGAVTVRNYSISDGIGIPRQASVVSPLFKEVIISTNTPLQVNKLYTLTARGISDCSGNSMIGANQVKTGLPSAAAASDVVINEVLFNPKPDGTDYVEIYNRSNHIFDLKDLYIANRQSGNMLGSVSKLSRESRLIFPDDYLVVTENAAVITRQYAAKNLSAFAEISPMPSYPDDKGTVVLLNGAGVIIDELHYDEKWHFKLIDNNKGVALERIDYSKPAQDAANWHSAATSAGYGTPTYQNSQFRTDLLVEGAVTISPEIFSPDNDGFNDFTTVYYQFPEPGYVCNITIYNTGGMPVKALTHNALCGTTGYFRWDGLDEKSNRLGAGIYIALVDVFNLKGKTKRFKKAVTLAAKLK